MQHGTLGRHGDQVRNGTAESEESGKGSLPVAAPAPALILMEP